MLCRRINYLYSVDSRLLSRSLKKGGVEGQISMTNVAGGKVCRANFGDVPQANGNVTFVLDIF